MTGVNIEKGEDQLNAQAKDLRNTFDKLKKKSDKLWKSIMSDTNLSEELVKEIGRVSERLKKVQHRIELRLRAKKEYGKTIAQTEQAYKSIMDQSKGMLQVLEFQAGEAEEADEDNQAEAARQKAAMSDDGL